MAAADFAESLRRVLAHEGGYSNNSSDPGGPTNFGITLADYRRYVKAGATAADVKAMPVATAKTIYRAHYWDAQRCDDLPNGVDYAVFDYGVNSGIARAGRVLRRCLKLADGDTTINDAVIAAARAADAQTLIGAICDERLRFLQSLKTWRVFGKGWTTRVSDVRSAALAMAQGALTPPLGDKPVAGRAVAPVAKRAQQGSAAAIAAATAAAAQQAHQAGHSTVVVAAIVIGGCVLAAAAWLFWRLRQQHQQRAAA